MTTETTETMRRINRIYLSGPMTGIADYNFPAFNAAAARLRKLGYSVANPAEKEIDSKKTWEDYLRADLIELLRCDAIALLPGWQKSKGANLELHVAHRVGIEIMDAADIKMPSVTSLETTQMERASATGKTAETREKAK